MQFTLINYICKDRWRVFSLICVAVLGYDNVDEKGFSHFPLKR